MASFCVESGKDKIVFLSEEDAAKPSTVEFTQPPEEATGLITKDGDINWNCPCLGGMPVGPCGVEFRDAFSCFHYSEAEPKGSDCFDKFMDMQECMKQYPDLYDKDDDPTSMDENENPDDARGGSPAAAAASDRTSSTSDVAVKKS